MDQHYRSINDDDEKPKTCPRWLSIGCGLFGVILATVVTFVLTRNYYTKQGTIFNPSQPFKQATSTEMSMLFTIPYIGLSEPFYAYTDLKKGKMTLSYYSGADIYYYDTAVNSTQYSLLPVYDSQVCLGVGTQNSPNPLPNLFPDLSLFTRNGKGTVKFPGTTTDIACDKWSYTAGTPGSVSPNSNSSSYNKPDAQGYAGQYDFYVDATTGNPVAFNMNGHNVINGGSHLDEYWLYYLSYKVSDSPIDDSIFSPPSGLICQDTNNPLGPTLEDLSTDPKRHLVRSDPAEDINMMMPQHTELRGKKFGDWAQKYGKTYASQSVAEVRSNIFHSNLRFVNARNRAGKSYSLAANHMADWTKTERQQLNGRLKQGSVGTEPLIGEAAAAGPNYAGQCGQHTNTGKTLPKEYDWRTQKIVNNPKDQGTCGSCWTYGTTGTIEGQYAKTTGKLVDLSEQAIMDCTWAAGNAACGGGTDSLAYGWLMLENGGQVASAADYGTDMNQNGFCHFALNNEENGVMRPLVTNPWTGKKITGTATIKSCWHITTAWNGTIVPAQQAMDDFTDALYNIGPISVSIDATIPDFYFYSKGIYEDQTCLSGVNDLDHIVLAVGYGTAADGMRYTIIRNSWSTHWGEEGYVRMSQINNICGVATAATYVLL